MNTAQITPVAAIFAAQFSKTKAVPFNPKWSNGTGYFDYAVLGKEAPLLEAGDTVCSEDPKGRKIIIIGTLLGNAVIFQRYSNRNDIYVCNTSTTMHHYNNYKLGGMLNEDALEYAFGYQVTSQMLLGNVGQRLQLIKEELSDFIAQFEDEKHWF